MRAAVVVFPGSNCDRDLAVALRAAGFAVDMVWHKDTALPDGVDLVGVPGGFSYGDYLRSGAIAAQSPILRAVRAHAERGGYTFGICNGFQVLCESGLLPGALTRNTGLTFVCRPVAVEVATADSAFTAGWEAGAQITLPVAHHDGRYVADADTLAALADADRVALRYAEAVNGSEAEIAGVLSADRRTLGVMPHPERAADAALGMTDGAVLFAGLAGAMAEPA